MMMAVMVMRGKLNRKPWKEFSNSLEFSGILENSGIHGNSKKSLNFERPTRLILLMLLLLLGSLARAS
jgi:hypothetical protein